MRRGSIIGVIAICACGARTSSREPSQPARPPMAIAQTPTAPVATPPPAVVAAPAPAVSPPPQPLPKQRFAAARRFIEKTKLDLYRYHEHRVGNVEGYLAPILATSDGGLLVVGTRADYPKGKYQVGKSRPVVCKLDAEGKLTWERAYRANGFVDYEGASAVEVDDGYLVYVLSYVHPGRGAVARLVRIDGKGGVVWDLKLRGQGRENTPFPQNVRLHQGQLLLDGHIYKDSSDTAYGWTGSVSLDGKLLSDEVGGANPYGKK